MRVNFSECRKDCGANGRCHLLLDVPYCRCDSDFEWSIERQLCVQSLSIDLYEDDLIYDELDIDLSEYIKPIGKILNLVFLNQKF